MNEPDKLTQAIKEMLPGLETAIEPAAAPEHDPDSPWGKAQARRREEARGQRSASEASE